MDERTRDLRKRRKADVAQNKRPRRHVERADKEFTCKKHLVAHTGGGHDAQSVEQGVVVPSCGGLLLLLLHGNGGGGSETKDTATAIGVLREEIQANDSVMRCVCAFHAAFIECRVKISSGKVSFIRNNKDEFCGERIRGALSQERVPMWPERHMF